MTRLYLVRHGKAAAGFDSALDPGLDATGEAQAASVAEALRPHGPLPILSSPMQRCRETAAPLAKIWNQAPVIEPRVTELPSPTDDLAERTEWLRGIMGGTWPQAGAASDAWRKNVVAALVELTQPHIVFSHFIAINVAVGAALGDESVVVFRPDNCSVTVLETDGARLHVISLGDEAETVVR